MEADVLSWPHLNLHFHVIILALTGSGSFFFSFEFGWSIFTTIISYQITLPLCIVYVFLSRSFSPPAAMPWMMYGEDIASILLSYYLNCYSAVVLFLVRGLSLFTCVCVCVCAWVRVCAWRRQTRSLSLKNAVNQQKWSWSEVLKRAILKKNYEGRKNLLQAMLHSLLQSCLTTWPTFSSI